MPWNLSSMPAGFNFCLWVLSIVSHGIITTPWISHANISLRACFTPAPNGPWPSVYYYFRVLSENRKEHSHACSYLPCISSAIDEVIDEYLRYSDIILWTVIIWDFLSCFFTTKDTKINFQYKKLRKSTIRWLSGFRYRLKCRKLIVMVLIEAWICLNTQVVWEDIETPIKQLSCILTVFSMG